MNNLETRRQWLRHAVALAAAVAVPVAARAANTPCSGKKGGISHCEGNRFRCKNGTLSASKKSCQAVYRPAARQKAGKPAAAPRTKTTK